MYVGLHVKYPLVLSDCNKTLIFWINFRKINVKFHGNSSTGNRVVPCGRTGRYTDRHDEANSRFSQFHECSYNTHILMWKGGKVPTWSGPTERAPHVSKRNVFYSRFMVMRNCDRYLILHFHCSGTARLNCALHCSGTSRLTCALSLQQHI